MHGKRNVMSRLKELRKYIDKKLNKMEDEDKRTGAISHLYGVSLAAQMIAKKRNLDPELAAMAAMLHDMHAYKTGSYDDHAHLGADYARNVLTKLELTTSEETDIICSAIYHHDDKLNVDGPRDTLLVALTKRARKIPIGAVSIALLSIATLVGWILGGPVGIGTLICAFATGPIMQMAFSSVKFDATHVHHQHLAYSMKVFMDNKPA